MLYRYFFIIVATITITACSHPIEIVGEGDVLSSTSDRDCLLEEFLSSNDNCAKNYVIGAYDETYHAVPRSGWKFTQWNNYCEEANTNTCSFNIPGQTVVNAWGATVPPLVAVFAPQGALLTGTQVSLETWYQQTPNSELIQLSVPITVTVVDPGVEFSSLGTLEENGVSLGLVDVAIDFKDAAIEIDFDNVTDTQYATGTENTYVFNFDSQAGVNIGSATIDQSVTTLGLDSSDITVSANQVRVNVESLAFNTSSFVRINLSSTP